MEWVSKTPIFAFSDLDDTLFQSRRRRTPDTHARVVAVDVDGNPGSFQCSRQQAFFALLHTHTTLIPVTARSTRALERVVLPFSSWRIAAAGAILLNADGEEDPEWLAVSTARIASALPILREMQHRVDNTLAQCGIPERCRILEDRGRPVYLVVKRQEGEGYPPEVHQLPVPDGIKRWITGENLVYAASDVTKRDAVQFLMDHHLPKDRLTLGFGDSPMDQEFLEICDYAGWPALNPYTRWRMR